MPALTYSFADFTAYTRIESAKVNAKFTDIKTLLNTTKLDSTNVQQYGLTRDRLAAGTAGHVVINDGSGYLSSEAALAVTRGGTGLSSAGTEGQWLRQGASAPAWTHLKLNDPYTIENLTLVCSVGSSALTIAVKTLAASDASATDIARVAFRSSTVTSGAFVVRDISAALSLVISSGSTLGHLNTIPAYIYVYAIDNAGTVELAVSTRKFDETTVQSTTAEGGAGGADSSTVLYSTTSRSNVAIRLIGRLTSNQTASGTWAAVPTLVTMTPLAAPEPRSEVYLETGNGRGSTNTVIRRFTTTTTSRGAAITYADSASNGASFTINEDGLYAISYVDAYSAGSSRHGVSVDSTELTTDIGSITASTRLGHTQASTGLIACFATTTFLTAGQVVRPHGQTTQDSSAAYFRITKVSN